MYIGAIFYPLAQGGPHAHRHHQAAVRLGLPAKTAPAWPPSKQFLASIPDAQLLEGLRQHRGRGRNDYPVHVLWGVLLLRIALRHVSIEATLAELNRNEALRRLIGIEEEEHVPKTWNISRFLDVLGQEPHLSELRRIFDAMVQRLGLAVPDLGKDTAGDSTALHARRKKDEKAAEAEIAAGLPQPSGGKKEYTRRRGQGDEDRRVVRLQAAPAWWTSSTRWCWPTR